MLNLGSVSNDIHVKFFSFVVVWGGGEELRKGFDSDLIFLPGIEGNDFWKSDFGGDVTFAAQFLGGPTVPKCPKFKSSAPSIHLSLVFLFVVILHNLLPQEKIRDGMNIRIETKQLGD